MISWLKKHFIPHGGNDHRPHVLRDSTVRYIVTFIIFVEIFSFLIPTLTHINTGSMVAAVLPAVLADLTNAERQTESLAILTVNPILNQAAEMKAKDMVSKGYFAHTSPEGKTPWYWLSQVGYDYQYAGENLAVNFSDSKDVTDAWMKSPAHKANIVKENYTEVGTGIASGMYEGRETTFVAQIYANPASLVIKQNENTQAVLSKVPARNAFSIADAGGEKVPVINQEEGVNVLGAEAEASMTVPNPTLLQKSLASPRNTTNAILYIVFIIITIALLLYVFIKMRNHHRNLITNGLIVLAIILAVFIVNYYVSYRDMMVTSSLDYGSGNK